MLLSRRQIALYAAHKLHEGKDFKEVAQQIAAYLHEVKKTNEAELLIRDIETIFSEKYGIAIANVATAHALSDEQRETIRQFIKHAEGAKEVNLEESSDKSLIGGMVIETPSARLDTSIARQLQQLKSLNN